MSGAGEHHLGEDLLAMAGGGAGLEASRKAELERHIAACEACREALAGAQEILRAIDESPRAEPSSDFDRRLFARLDAIDVDALRAKKAGPSFSERLRRLLTMPRLGGLAAAAAAIALVVIMGRGERSGPPELHRRLAEEAATNMDGLRVADDLALYRDYEVAENLDVLDDLDAIQSMEEAGG